MSGYGQPYHLKAGIRIDHIIGGLVRWGCRRDEIAFVQWETFHDFQDGTQVSEMHRIECTSE
jgi:hypothetical protein